MASRQALKVISGSLSGNRRQDGQEATLYLDIDRVLNGQS
jgi:hypothetical protein